MKRLYYGFVQYCFETPSGCSFNNHFFHGTCESSEEALELGREVAARNQAGMGGYLSNQAVFAAEDSAVREAYQSLAEGGDL